MRFLAQGGFPGPLNGQNINKGLTYTRNFAIAKVFREAGFGEKLGTAFYTIFSSYEEYGLPSPTITGGENLVKCILPRLAAGKPRVLKKEEEKLIVKLLENATELTMGELVENLRLSRSTVKRRLDAMIEKGIIRTRGAGSGTRYLLVELSKV